ncbi:MAG: hypothetical protein NTU49_07015, partial [Gammaproteobacteria bacterium]|nr:hypothetical protein [Gammaproteobacteria bacterium]
MPFSELTQIDETARLLKRAGFTVLIPVSDELQNYDMQLFNHLEIPEEDLENIEESLRGRVCNISEVGNKTRAEMANCALAQKKVKADELFFIDDVKKELDSHYLANFVSRCNVLSKKTENNQASIALNIDFDCFSIEDQPELAKIICTADYPIILNISVRGLSKTSFNILSEIIQNAIMPITLNFRAVGQDENWVKLINEIKNAKQPITLNLPGGYSNVLSSAGIDALADAIQYAKQPINLTLSLGDQDVAKLVNAIQNAAQDITIKFNPKPLSSESVALLIDAAKNSKRLIKLDFSQVGLSALQVVESIRYARQPVSFLIENSHFLDKIAVEQLLDAIQNTRQPITLEFDKNYMLNEKYILEIIKALRMTKQSITLNFKAYSLASNVLAALVDAVQNAAGPITLNLTGHTLDTFNLSTLTNAIKFAKHPITLNLSSSRLRDDSFNALIDIIQNTAQALTLDLRNCELESDLKDRFITELEVAIKNTKQPITLYLSASPFSAAFINTLIKAIQDTNNPITLHISDSASECDALSLMALKKQVENSKRPVTFTVTSVGNLELVKYLSRRQQNEEVVFNRQDKREITYQCSLQDDDGAASLPLYDLDKEQFAVNIEELCVDTSSAGCKYFLGEKFPNLKYLSVSSISSNRVIDIKAENLTHCELHFNHYSKKPMIMMDYCFFLQRLDCFLEAWGEGYNFPINISLPNLLELHIHGALYSLTSLFSFFEETPHLRLLELTNTNVSNSDLKEINTLYPRLTVIIHGMNRSNTQSAETVPHGFGERLFTESHTTERQLGAPPSRPETPDEGREKDIVYMSSTAAGELVSDFNTQHNPNETFTLQAACKHISTQKKNRFKYTRDAIYTLDKNSQLAPVKAHQFSDYQLPDYQIKLPADSKHDFFEFKQPIYLKEGQAYPLTGLSANDILFQLTLNGKPLNEAQINGEIEITKDELGFYSLKAKKELRGNLGYLLDTPPEKKEALRIPEKLQEEIDCIRGFPGKNVTALIIDEHAPPDKKLEAMYEQRKASCRHRVAIFLHQLRKLKTANPEDYKHIEARIVDYSGIHANIEISADSGENFEILELGGFEVKTQYVSTLLPKLQFSSKQKKDAPKPVFSDVLNQIKSGYGKNTLLCLQNESDVYPCLSYIRQKALPNRPVFYVDSPDSLRTSLKRLKLNAERTCCEIVEPNPGAGLLYDFLMMHQHSDPPPIIVINWDNFKPKDIVQFNSVIDIDKRRTGKTPIPVNATIVGLHSRDEKMLDLLCDTSFVSRHAKGGIHDFSDKPLPDRAKTLTASSAAVVPKVLKINLHQSPRWLDIAVGKAFVDGEKLCWQDGQLLDIFADSAISHVEFINPPIHDRSFEYFIADLRAGLPITVLNQQMSIDRSIDVTISDQLTFENNVDIFIQRSAALKEDTFIINSSIFEQCLQGKRIKEDGLLISEKGLIEAHENNKLKLCISDTLSDSQWSLLLDYAKRFHVVLEISVTDNVVLPPTLQFVALPAKLNTLSSQPNRFIVSDDVELSVANIQEKLPSKTMVIDFSEVSLDDLFCGITHTTTDIGFLFYKQFSSVWEALSRGDTVILKGDCSKEKLDYLASLFSSQPYFYFEGQKHFFRGKLIVVADQTLKPPDWLHAEEQIVREEQGYLQKLQLQKKAAVPPLVLDVPDSEDLSLNASDLFEENRIKSVKHIFSFSPYALLEGAPGVGKSYFVRVLENDPAIKLYREDEIEKWASDPDELIDINDPLKGFKQKILFRDEINLRATDCSQDRDLMNDPPSIFINGKHYFLTENCKILYAQNPVDYGGKRCEPKLFQDLPDCKVTF